MFSSPPLAVMPVPTTMMTRPGAGTGTGTGSGSIAGSGFKSPTMRLRSGPTWQISPGNGNDNDSDDDDASSEEMSEDSLDTSETKASFQQQQQPGLEQGQELGPGQGSGRGSGREQGRGRGSGVVWHSPEKGVGVGVGVYDTRAGASARGSPLSLPGLQLVTQMEDIDQNNHHRSTTASTVNDNGDNDYGGEGGDDDEKAMTLTVAAGIDPPSPGPWTSMDAATLLSAVARGVQGAESLCDDLDRYGTVGRT